MSRNVFFVFVLFTLSAKSQLSIDTSSYIQRNPVIYSLVVSVKDTIVYARSFNGKKNDDLFNNQSLTKNIEAVLIGIAIDKGYIKSLNTKIADILPALKNDPDKRKLAITVGDVMNQASGLWHEDLQQLPAYLALDNPSGHVLKQPLVSDPGKVLHYNNAASHLLSVILSTATGQTTFDFARKYLFEPLDIHQIEWPTMKDGYNDGSGLLNVRLRTMDINKIGSLLLQGGRYKGVQVVSSKWVQSLLEPANTYPAPWGLPNTRYALCFYHRMYQEQTLIYGMGWGGQFLLLIPGLHTVISINQAVNDRTAIQQSANFWGKIFPLIFEEIKARQ